MQYANLKNINPKLMPSNHLHLHPIAGLLGRYLGLKRYSFFGHLRISLSPTQVGKASLLHQPCDVCVDSCFFCSRLMGK